MGAPETQSPVSTGGQDANLITREGVVVDYRVTPSSGAGSVTAEGYADVTFRITDSTTGAPITGRYPAAWMDLSQAWEAKGDRPMDCREKVSTYLKGIVGLRPMIDLNSHFLLVMNRDASISVIDPAVGITGITNLFAQISLKQPPADWAKTRDQSRLFVTMPRAGSVAVADAELFKVTGEVPAGEEPTRAELQGDERYLWVGNNGSEPERSGVTVIDTEALEPVAFIQTGKGHHEIAFSENDRYAFVTNREAGTVTVIDVQKLEKVKDLKTGPLPIAIAYSPLSKSLYVADGKAGTVSVIEPDKLEIVSQIEAKPGLGPMRFSEDGRWGVVVNPVENEVQVVDASTDRLVHTIPVGKQPYQVTFTRQFAYVRSLGSEDVGMISVSELDREAVPFVKYFPAGEQPPGRAADLGISDSMVPSVKEAALFVVNQFQGTLYYYMEGMNAPQGAFRNYGHEARAVETVDRSLRELQPGVYTGRAKLPVAGTYDVAFVMDTPQFVHCFSAEVEPNPEAKTAAAKMEVEFQVAERTVSVGETRVVRFRLTEPGSGVPVDGLEDVTVLSYASDGRDRNVVTAQALGGGIYEAPVKVNQLGTYYVFVASRSQEVTYTDLPFLSLIGLNPARSETGEQNTTLAPATAEVVR